ncbi:MAG: TIGR03663 family protein [Archaeoglobaceae archaeon]|nr:TIGR03663 family protein [Archaeoglobaceae archaeon]
MKKILIIMCILTLALTTRLLYLDQRTMDHDESVHAWISLKQVLEHPTYIYDPAFHGPFLYFAISLSFILFGDGDLQARLPVAFFCILGVFFALRFEKWIGKSAYILALFLLFSPSILYYSRYARDDVIVISSFLAVIYFYLRYKETQKAYYAILASLFLAIIFTSKENWVQYFGVLFLAVFADAIVRKNYRFNFKVLVPAIVVFAFFSSFLYSSAFAHAIHGKNWLEVMLDEGWVRNFMDRSLPYWFAQGVESPHSKQLHYYFDILFRYEFLPLSLAIASVAVVLRKRMRNLNFLELTAICWVIFSFVFYNAMAYKTSWLVIHLATPLAFFGAIFVGEEIFRRKEPRIVYAVGLIATTLIAFHVAYLDFNNVLNQPLIYVQTQWGAVEMAERIRELLRNGYDVAVFAVDGHYWPLPWILRNEAEQYAGKLTFTNSCPQNYDYVFAVYRDYGCLEGYEIVRKYELRKYWEFYELKRL